MQKEILNEIKKIMQEQTARVKSLPKEVYAQKSKIAKLKKYDARTILKQNGVIPELSSRPWGCRKTPKKRQFTKNLEDGK
jgi:hypothetical protein